MRLGEIIPELVLAAACLALVAGAPFAKRRTRRAPAAVLAIALIACLWLEAAALNDAPSAAFHGTYAVDGLARVFKILVVGSSLVVLLLIRGHFRDRVETAHAPAALAFLTLGAMGVCSSADLVLLLLFLQMMSTAGYVLVLLERAPGATLEAGLKYFLYGAVALAVMTYGLSLLYGLTGELGIDAVGARLAGTRSPWVAVAATLVFVGFAFEIALAPFHVWLPDVLEGTTAPVAALISVTPKIAAFAGLVRFLSQGLASAPLAWKPALAIVAALTMTTGNVLALRQEGLKRLLAYSSVAQAGYALVALAALGSSDTALPAVAFYLAAYAAMNLAAFGVVASRERGGARATVNDLRGLAARAPTEAIVMALALLSLAGIPPLAGFAGKVFVLTATLDAGMTWLAVLAAANMAFALVYYVRLLVAMFFDVGRSRPLPWTARRAPLSLTVALLTTAALIVYLGVLPDRALGFAAKARAHCGPHAPAVHCKESSPSSVSPCVH